MLKTLALTRSRLAIAILAPVIALATLATIVILAFSFGLASGHDHAQERRTAGLVASLVATAAQSFRLPESLQDYVAQVARDQAVTGIVVAAGTPLKVIASNRADERGLAPDRVRDQALAAALGETARGTGRDVVAVEDGDFLIHVVRLPLASVASEGAPTTALVGVRLELASLHWVSRTRAAQFVAGLLATAMLFIGLAMLVLRQRVFAPLEAIGETARRRRDGDRSARVPVAFDDEIGDAAAELNAAMDATAEREAQDMATRQQIISDLTRFQQDLAYDLHDHVGGDLGGLAFRARALAERLKADGIASAGAAEELTAALGSVADRTRALSRMLAPTSPEQGGLVTALARLCRSVGEYSGVDAVLRTSGDLPVLDNWQANHVYLIAQESLRNAVKHGRSRRIRIALASRPGELVLRVTSQQDHWDPDAHGEGHGIRIIRYRAESLDAALSIRVRPNGVTRVRLAVPVGADTGTAGETPAGT